MSYEQMGRNILSICDYCGEYIFHLRGKENQLMQPFQKLHSSHEKNTRIVSDYVTEAPDDYEDVTDSVVKAIELAKKVSQDE